MQTDIFTDPVAVGPGIWFNMHLEAVHANTDERKRAFNFNVNRLCDNFKCNYCQKHFRQFIIDHPLKNYWGIFDKDGHDIGFFQWTWELHNQVNRRLHKYQPSLSEAYEFFTDAASGACFNCGNEDVVVPKIITEYTAGTVKPKPLT